ncbi:TIMELESS-interacting protein-like [Amphibalanus amphitrite]|uniref:TIMELESS-interacting protein-like n=1 Tax=Amphibalanus amphitrite TaxID=1232801 RepID=UPI001C8FB11C|nr:TIMELESS-interacting protein-like [Amphibalanus amphitrite]
MEAIEANAADPKPKKKRVSRPQPKLNADRLCGPRGIGIMEQTFSDLAFAGRGHERRDLALLMGRMQHWAHRLFPRRPFDQTIEQIEKLGKGRQVKVNVRKLRMGLNVLPTEVDGERDATERGEPERDVFDELIGGSPPGSPAPPRSPAPAERPPSPQSQQHIAASSLTEEQKERMRKNREAAQLRRMRAQFSRQQQSEQSEQSEQQSEPQSEPQSEWQTPPRPGRHSAPTSPQSASPQRSQPVGGRSPPAGGDPQ